MPALGALPYDYLVLALGATVNFFGVAGAAEHAFPLYTLADAVRLKEQLLERWEAADQDPALVDDGALNVVVVGGGATGVESAGALIDLYRGTFARDYPGLPARAARVILVEHGPALLPMFTRDIQAYTKQALEQRGVEVWLGERVVEVAPTRVTLASGDVFKAHTLVWGAGCRPTRCADPRRRAAARRAGAGRPRPEPGRAIPRSSRSATSPGSPTRRRSRSCRSSARSRCSAASARARTSPGGSRAGDRAVHLPRQGHDGDDRPRRGRHATAAGPDDDGQDGAAGLGRGAPGAAAHRRGPREDPGRLGGLRAHAPALGPDQGRYLGVRPGLHLDAVAGHLELDPTRSALAGTDRGAEVVAAGSAYRSAKPCRQVG